ncbi:DNA helicase [uncultured phage cr29_1]|uniref:DNA helicase n=1 Tax=uncultured phage cr29_1 TaxID=2986418 RepID=UPI001C77F1AA|nr:DNA helicase [uncultured phage cr29_1]
MANRTRNVSPSIIPWGSEGSTYDPIGYIRRNNSTPYSRVTNRFRSNLARYLSTSPVQRVVNKGYKDYVNVSKSLNTEERETRNLSDTYNKLKKAKEVNDELAMERPLFRPLNPGFDFTAIGKEMLGDIFRSTDQVRASNASGKVMLNKETSATVDLAKKNKELKLLRLQLLQQLQDYSNNRSNLSNRDKLNIIRINNQIKLLDKQINNGEVYEQRAEQLRAQHDMDNVWNSVKEGLAGAGGFLLDVLGKAGAYLNTSNAYGVHNNLDYKTLKMNDKEKFSLAAHLYIYDKNIDNNRKRFLGLPLKDSLRAQIDDYTDFQTQLNAEIKGAQEDYEKHVRYRQADEKWFPISDDYNKKKLRYANASVFSPEYWQYEMPSQIAASNASTAGRIAMALNTGAAIGGAFLGPKGQALLNIGSLVATTATGLDIENMKFENRGEVSDANVDKLKSNLMSGGKKQYQDIIKDLREKAKLVYPKLNMNPDTESDDEILRSALAGIITSNHPEYRKAELRALAGSNALFQKDNITTGSDLMVQKGLQVGIFGRELYKAGKGTINWIANKTIKRAANSATGAIEHTVEGAATNAVAEAAKDAVNGSRYATLRKEFTDSFRGGFGLGEQTATVLGHGMTGLYVYGTMTGIGKAVLDLAKKALPTRGLAFIRLATHRAGLYYQDILDKIPLTARRLSAYGLKMGKVWVVSSASEAAEEARQYVNAEQAKRQQMGLGELPSLGSLFANEYSAGSRTQAAILAELGIGDSDLLDNEEFWLNYKGGFALGGGHTVAMRAVSEIPGLVRQISADLAILNAGITNRVMMQNERALGQLFAKEAMKGRSNMELILNTMQLLKLEDARRKEHTYSSDEWDSSIKAALDIMRMTLSPTTKAIMEKHGIQYGTDKYAAAVASVYLTGLNSDENRDLRQKAIDEYNLIIHSVQLNQAIDEELRRRLSGSSIESLALQRADKARQEAEQNALSLEELGLEVDLISAQSELDKLNRMTGPTGISNVEDLRQRTILVGLLRGLLKLRSDCKTSDGFFNMLRDKFGLHTIREDAAKIHKSIDSDIKIISQRLSELSGINLDGLNDAQVMDKLDAMGAIELFSDDIEENTRVRALLNADAKLIADRLKMFSDGLKAEGNGNTKFSKFIDDVMATTERNKAIDWALADAINDPYGQKWNQDNTSTGEINTEHKDTLSHVESLTKLENKVYTPENNYSVENNTFENTDRPYVHDDLELKIKEDKLGSVGKLKGKIDDMILRGRSYDKINRWLLSSKRYKNIITRNEDNARIIEDYINDLLLNAGLEPNRAIVDKSKPDDELADSFERLNNLSEQRQERNERRAKIEAKKRLLKSKMKAAIKEWARSGEAYSGISPKFLSTLAKLVAYGTLLGYYSFKTFLDDIKDMPLDAMDIPDLSGMLSYVYLSKSKELAGTVAENLDSEENVLSVGSVLNYLKNDKTDQTEQLKQNVDKLVQQVKQNLSNIDNIESAIQKIADLSLTPFDKTSISQYILDIDKLATEDLLKDAIKQLGNIIQNTNLVYNDLTDLLNNLNDLKEIPQDPLVTDYNDLPKTVALLVLELEDACNTLDSIASTIADVKPTTLPERDAINDLSIQLMRAEIALDNLLQDNEALAVNVSLERDLIDNVIMKFNNNRSIWGDTSEEILDWWFTKYAKDNVVLPRDSRNTITNGSDNLTLDYNQKITDYMRLYGNKFQQNLGEVESDWYWRLLKNYFGTLLNNAQDYIEQNPDNPMNPVLLDNINRGRLLISGFANKYGKQLDDSYMDTDASIIKEAEELNKQEFMWYESGGNNYISGQGVGTTLHRPGVKAMQENKTYVEWSNQPDFITNGKFEIIFRNATEYSNRPYLRITYKGQSIELHIYEGGDESRIGYQQHLVDLWKFCLKHKNYSLRVIPTRTNGSLIYDPAFVGYNENSPTVEGLHSVVGNIMSLDDTYSIDLKSKLIGIVKLDKKGNMNVMSLDGLNSPIHTLNSARVGTQNTSVGSTVYLWHTNFDEKKGNLTTIPVILYQSKLSLNQADSLVDLLRAYALGLVNYNGYNTYDLIKMLVHVNENNLPNYKTNQTRTITFSSNKLIIIGLPQYDDNGKHIYGTGESYDLTSEHDLERLRTDLRSVGVAFEKTMLSQLLNFTNNSVINNVKHYFEDNPNVDTFVAPNGLEFSRDDFFDQDGNERRKSTYAGYLMRHQYTLTSVVGLNYTATYFRGPYLVPNTKQDDRIDDILTERQKEDSISMPRLNSLKNLLNRSRGLKLEVLTNKLRDITDGDREQMNAYLKRVIGEGNYEIGKLLNDDIPADMAVAGKCMSDMVYIGNRVVDGVQYHEAFHRVLELLLRPSERQKIYDWYKSREGNDKMSDTEIAEGLANLYMDAQNNYDDNEFSNNKVVALFLKIKAGVQFARNLGSIRLTLLSAIMSTGWYKTKAGSKIRKENLERFKAKFGDSLHYDVYNQKTGMKHSFENILNNEQLNDCVETIAFYIVEKALEEGRVNAVGDNIDQLTITGTNIKKLIGVDMMKLLMGEDPEVPVPEALAKAFQEIFKQGKEKYITDKNGVAIGKELYYPNFAVIADRVYAKIANISKEGVVRNTNDEDMQEQLEAGSAGAYMDYVGKESYEMSKLQSVSQKAKFFFGTVPYVKWANANNHEEGIELDTSHSLFGDPRFMPLTEVFSKMFELLHNVKTVQELHDELARLASLDPMFFYVYSTFDEYFLAQYIDYDKTTGEGINYNAEAVVTQVFQALVGQKYNFMMTRSSTDKDGNVSIRMSNLSVDRDTLKFSQDWSKRLANGVTGVVSTMKDLEGRILFNRDKNGVVYNAPGKDIFKRTSNWIKSIWTLANAGNDIKIGNNTYDITSPALLSEVIDKITITLNKIGILIDSDTINYMLINKYGEFSADSFRLMLNETVLVSLSKFLNLLDSVIGNAGLVEVLLDTLYNKDSFVNELAKYQSMNNKVKNEMMNLLTNNNKAYTQGENNTVSDILADILDENPNNEAKLRILNFCYNKHSIVLRRIAQNEGNKMAKILMNNYAGFKTDQNDDYGSDYNLVSNIEDYMSKVTMLISGGLIYPTMSDKKTYMYLQASDQAINGFLVPGIDYRLVNKLISSSDKDQKSALRKELLGALPRIVTDTTGKTIVRPSNLVLDIFIDYAKDEKAAIIECMHQLGYFEGDTAIDDTVKIKNYHTPNKYVNSKGETVKVEPNGTRFSSLTSILDDNGNRIKFNDPKKSSIDCLKLADELFFNKSREQLRNIMARVLDIQFKEEVKKAIKLGLIKGDIDNYYSLENVGLSYNEFSCIRHSLAGTEGIKTIELLNAAAVVAMMSDVSTRSIISVQEVERLFGGHPAFYKWLYSENELEDRQTDQLKRLGGLISTGANPRTDFQDDSESKYTCAQVDDFMVSSEADKMHDGNIDDAYQNSVEKMFVQANTKEAVYNKLVRSGKSKKEAADIAYAEHKTQKDFEEFRDKYLDENDKSRVTKKYQAEYKAYAGKIYDPKAKDPINVADGSAFITDKMCEKLLRSLGLYSNKAKLLFAMLRDPNNQYTFRLKADAFTELLEFIVGAQKYSAFGHRNDERLGSLLIPYYNKMALFPIFPSIAMGDMGKVYNKMINEGVDMLLFDSAVKIGNKHNSKFEQGKGIEEPFVTFKLDLRYLRKLLNTDPNGKIEMNLGTLTAKVALASLIIDRVNYTDSLTGEAISGSLILDNIMDSINLLSDMGVKEVDDLFFTDGEFDIQKFAKFLNDELTSRNANKNTIDAITIKVDDADGSKHLNVPLSAQSDPHWIESILTSALNKRIVDVKTPGNAFYQRSVFAMEGHIVSDDEYDTLPAAARKIINWLTLNEGKQLQFINNDGSMDAVISIDYFEHIIPKGMSFDLARKWLFDNKIIGNRSDVKANTIGYRIPTQAQSSIHALRFVDVLPVVKDTIILPREFTKVTGSDFDIDKLYLASLAYDVKDSKATREFPKGTKLYYQNKLLENYMTLLKDNDNSIQIAMRSIDNDTDLVLNIANQFDSAGSTKTLPYNFYTLHELTDRRRDYITGKLGIAPFALNVTNLALTMAYGVKLKETEFTKQTPFKRIDLRDDKNGNAVMSWLSAFINAHCDIVKDPYVSKINVNSFTYNMLNFLVRTGLADNSVWFITLPIIKDMAFAAEAASGHYGRDLTKSKYRALKDATEKALRQYIAGYLGKGNELYSQDVTRELGFINSVRLDSLDEIDLIEDRVRMLTSNLLEATSDEARIGIQKLLDKELRILNAAKNNSPIRIINSMFDSEKYLKNYALKYTNKEDMLKDPDFCRALVQVYKAWNILQPFVNDISKLVQLTKIDTKKQGNTLAKLLLYKEKYDLFLKDIQQGNTSFEPEGVMKMMTHSWIDKKTNSFMKAMKSILAGQVFEATTSYTSLVGLLGLFMNNYSLTEDIANKLDRNVSQCIKSLFIRAYAGDDNNKIDVNRLFFGNNTIADRLAGIKRRINNPDDKLFYLRNNKLLTSLVESDLVKDESTTGANGLTYPAPKFVSTFHSISESSFNQDDLTDAWEELLNYPDDLELKEFARDLVVYAWLTSGEKSGFNRFFKYVPNSWKINSGFVGHVEFWLNKFNTNLEPSIREAIIDDILRNNWNDTDFVPQYDYERKGRKNFTDSGIYDPLLMKPFALCGYALDKNSEYVTTINRLDNGQYPRYITVKDELSDKYNNNVNRSLYRLVGVSKFNGIKDKDTGNVSLTEVPIYVLCKKKGLHFKGNDIFEFGNSDFGFGMNYIGYQENDAQYAKLVEEVKLKFYINAKKLEPKETKTESPVRNTDVTTVRSTGKSGGITYNKELQSAIVNAVSFLKTNTDPTLYYVIEGKAGTGKTTIAKEILKEFEDEQIYVAAVSHKAKGVIKSSFGDDTRGKKFFSIAGLLGMKGINDNDTLTTKFQVGLKVPLLDNPPALLVIDEASMITEDVLKKIIDINSSLSRPFLMLFLGDIGQILPIRDEQSEFYRTNKDLLNKKSDIFNSKHKSKLITRVRLGEANPILPYADYFWENSLKENPELNPTQHIVRNNQITDKGSLLFSNSEGEVLNSVIKAVKNAVEKGLTNHVKIVTYHVNEKTELNQKIHEALFGKDSDYSKGDMLILNSPYDLPDVNATMENSSEILIKSILDEDTDEFGVHTLYLETNGTAYTRTGNEQKDCVILVVSRNDIGLYNQKLLELASYAKRLTNRALKKLAWSDFWEYKGRYADVDFGYAITAHKSLGSTYDIVVVDEKDIMGTTATSNQEKSELIYTALTRPRKTAIVISSVPVSNPYTGDIENPSLPKQQNERKIDYHSGNWTRLEVNDNPDVLYVFGDNTNRTSGSNPISNDSKYARTYGLGKMFPNTTAAIIRGMDNAMPVSTQHWYDPTTGRTRDAGRWNDSDIDDFKKIIDAEFLAIKDEWDTGKYRKIYLPSTGLSNGKISLITEARTPVLFKYLYDKTADLAKYVSTEHKNTHNVSYELALKIISFSNTMLQKQLNNPQDYTMNSGGAYGGDTYWDVIGRLFGLTNINHFRPADNLRLSKTLRDRNVKPFSITHEQSNYARELIKQLTGRELPYDVGGELLARDFYQVDKSDGVFAIANITSSYKAVLGGTNMAVQVGIKLGKPVHVYDLNTESWYLYNQSTGRFEVEDTPVLTKSFAGVGTRNILNYKVNKNGLWVDREGYVGYDKALKAANAIKAVYLKTFNTAQTSNTVNIYAGTGENADLSNFAIRPFTHHFNDGSVKDFLSVELAFLYIKASEFADTRSNDGNTRPSGKSILAEIMDTTTGSLLRSLGRLIKNLNVLAWDRSSSFVMKQLLKESFEQNPQALQRLLSTGNATLTHVQDNSKWGKEFPKLLMEVREELRKKQDSYKVKNDLDIKDDLKELGKRRLDDCNK